LSERRAVRAKEFPFLVAASGRRLLMVSILYKEENSKSCLRMAELFAKYNLRILSLFKQELTEGSEWTFFLDVTETSGLEEWLEAMRKLPGVVDFYVSKPEENMLTDVFHFPLTSRKGVRMVIFSAEMLSRTLGELYKVFGTGAQFITYRIGFDYGIDLGNHFRTLFFEVAGETPPPSQIIDFFLRYNMSAGWQIIQEFKVSEEKGKIKALVRTKELFEASARKKGAYASQGEKAGCDLFRGMLAGLFTSLYGKEFRVWEVKCEGKGDPYCEFSIQQV